MVVGADERVPRYLTRSLRNRMGFASWESDAGARCMSEHMGGRCVALRGVMGGAVRCSIYDRRPEICRQFEPGSGGCLEARAAMAHRMTRMEFKPRGYGPDARDGGYPDGR